MLVWNETNLQLTIVESVLWETPKIFKNSCHPVLATAGYIL
jgi:hypothetical protein